MAEMLQWKVFIDLNRLEVFMPQYINSLQASRRILDDELTARLSAQREVFSYRRSSLSSEVESSSTYERIFPLGSDYQEPSHLIRKLPVFGQSTGDTGEYWVLEMSE